MKIGEFIKAYLDEHGISQRQFADKIGVSPSYINILVKGMNNSTGKPMIPSLPIMSRIAKGMGMSIDDLFASVDDMDIYLPPETRIREEYANEGIAARVSVPMYEKKTALDQIIDNLLEYREGSTISPDEQRLLDAYRLLNTKQKAKVFKLIDAIFDN